MRKDYRPTLKQLQYATHLLETKVHRYEIDQIGLGKLTGLQVSGIIDRLVGRRNNWQTTKLVEYNKNFKHNGSQQWEYNTTIADEIKALGNAVKAA